MSWTEERIDKLTKMWEGGAIASQIADELGGVSRNAVIGKAHRLGLKARPSPVKPNEKPEAAPAAAKPAKPVPEVAPAAPARPAPKPVAASPAPVEPPAPASAAPATAAPAATPQPRIVSVGPGGFLRQGPGDQHPQQRQQVAGQ
ncbi:MAG TPA: GcrA family cell cycle regulator, partial [Novosphingobium sp.]|nr:GcrA family cell cycle regulator [Novosphingobium sp.]